MKDLQKVCAVTGKKLTSTANLHHMCMDPAKYEDLRNKDNFVFLSKQAHETVHWLWGKGNNDWRSRLKNLWKILSKMEKINEHYEMVTDV